MLEHPAKRKCLFWGRRSGKTKVEGQGLIDASFSTPNTKNYFLSITKSHAKKLIWQELQDIDKDYSLGLKFNHADLTVEFPNGSWIYVDGVETKADCERFRGLPYKLVCIDEAGSFKEHIEYLIHDVITPALIDYDGSIWLSGTPNEYCAGYFYDRTKDLNPSNRFIQSGAWACWYATFLDNPKVPAWAGKKDWRQRAQTEWDRLKTTEGVEHPDKFQREVECRWIRPDTTLVLPFADAANTFTELPQGTFDYFIGIDFGSEDPTAIVIGGLQNKTLYIVEALQDSHLSYDETAQLVLAFTETYNPVAIVADPNPGKQFIEDMAQQYGLPIESAHKRDKVHSVQNLAQWFKQGRVRFKADLTDAINELKRLQWRQDGLKKEIYGDDHIFDALRYLHVYAAQLVQEEPKQPKTQERQNDPYEQYLIDEMNRDERDQQFY